MQHDLSGTGPVVWQLDPERPDPDIIAAAAALIEAGGVVIYPTETFYAIGGLPQRVETIERIVAIKGRSRDKPFPLIAASEEDARKAVADWSATAEKLARRFWPGPLTLLLPASSLLPKELHLGTGRIAIRISPHPIAIRLAGAAGGLLIATSANISGQPAVSVPDRLDPTLRSALDGLLLGGRTPGQMPSTIVAVTAAGVRLIRTGALPWSEIENQVVGFSRHRSTGLR